MHFNPHPRTFPVLAAAVVAAILVPSSMSRAADKHWLGNGASNLFGDPANWNGGVPLNGDLLFFDAPGTSGTTLQNNLSLAYAGLTWTKFASAYALVGDPYILSFLMRNNSNFSQAVQNLALNGFLNAEGQSISINSLTTIGGSRTLSVNLAPGYSLTLGSIAISDSSASRTFTLGGAGTTYIAGPITNGGTAISGSLAFTGAGNTTLSGTSTYTGSTTIGGIALGKNTPDTGPVTDYGSGRVTLDFTTPGPANNRFYNGVTPGALNLGGGWLDFKGADFTGNYQDAGNVSLYTGHSRISITPGLNGSFTLNLGTLARPALGNTGSLNFKLAPGATVTTNSLNNPNGGLLSSSDTGNSVVTINKTDWAYNSTNTVGGAIAAFNAYVASTPTLAGATAQDNINVVSDASLQSLVINSLRFNAPSSGLFTNTLNIAAGQSLRLANGGLLVTPNVGNSPIHISGGILMGATSRALNIFQYNDAAALIIDSVIANNGNHNVLNIAGCGEVVLKGPNTYSGGTHISGAKLSASSDANLGGAGASVNLDDAIFNALESFSTSRAFGLSNRGGTLSTPAGVTLTLGNAITGGVTGEARATLTKIGPGTLTSTASNAYGDTIIKEGTLQIGNGGSTGTLPPGGTVTNSGSLVFFRSGSYIVSSAINGTGSLTKTGNGTLTLTGTANYTGTTFVNQHIFNVSTATGEPHSIGPIIGTGGNLRIFSGATLTSGYVRVLFHTVAGKHVVRPGSGYNETLELNIMKTGNAFTGRFDINDNPFILRILDTDKPAQISILRDAINSGYNEGTWTGPGITSSTVAANPLNLTLALADNADLKYTSFAGAFMNDNALIVAQALLADANLDGKVDAFDLNLLANHWQQPANAITSDGDHNRDGKVDAFDLNILAAHWQTSLPLLAALDTGQSTMNPAPAAPIPEPTSILMFALPAALLSRRRRVPGKTSRGNGNWRVV